MKRIVISAIAFAALLAFIVVPNKADAYSGQSGWADWLIPTGTICLQTQGSTLLATVAADWNKSDAVIVSKTSCDGFARNMTVKYVGINKPSSTSCAWTGSDSGWTRQNVRGLSILTPNGPTVWINYGASKSLCRATYSMIKHVWEHEFGHVLGLAHNSEPSIMAQGKPYGWAYNSPTALDLWRVNYRY